MADYSDTKPTQGSIFPANAVDSSRQHVEPLLTPDLLKTRHLFGIPLVSANKDPLTGRASVMTDDILSDLIDGAISTAEQELGIDIFPTQHQEKYPWDINLYNSFGYLQLKHKPARSVEKLSITPASESDVYIIPLEWLETSNLIKGQLNIVPLTVAWVQGTALPQQSTGGAAFLNLLGNRFWVPAWWACKYTTGFADGMLPRVINEYIGTIAALEVLSMLAPTYARSQSHSLGIDGLSQSVSTPGPQIFKVRIDELEMKRNILRKKIKTLYHGKIFSGTL